MIDTNQRLRDLCRFFNISVTEACRQANVNLSTIYKARQRGAALTVPVIEDFCRVFGILPEDFFVSDFETWKKNRKA